MDWKINYVKVAVETSPWEDWFAWFPVIDINNNLRWLTTVRRRWANYYYSKGVIGDHGWQYE